MANKFEIQVVALDKATAVFRKINTGLAQSFRPVQRMQKQLGALHRELHLDKITKGMRGLSAASMKVASSLGLSAGPLEALFGLGAAGGIVAVGAAVAALGARWGNMGFEVSRTSQAIGVSTDDLQKYRAIAGLAGISSEQLTGSLGQLGRTLQDAQFGRNPEAFQVLNKFGIGVKRNANGVVDTVGTLKEIAEVIGRISNPQVREKVADILGVHDLLPLLLKGRQAIEDYERQAVKMGLVLGPEQIKQANEFGDSFNRLSQSISGAANSLGSKFTPALTRAMDIASKSLTGGFGAAFWDFITGKTSREFAFGSARGAAQRGGGTVTDATGGALPIGLRQNNPGNLRAWGGAGSVNGFASFDSPQAGLNAMAQQLGLYQNRDKIDTIAGIVSKYAPASENNTGAYIGDVSKQTGYGANAHLNLNDPAVLAPLLSAMVRHEQGRQPFSGDEYNQAARTLIKVDIANAPPGTRVTTSGGSGTPPATQIAYSLPPGDLP